MRRMFKYSGFGVVLFFIGSQFVQPDRTNPPVDPASSFEAVAGPDAETAAILKRACYDCHSNTTEWPWYSQLAPASWLVAEDVKDGRARLNFSQWNLLSPEMSKRRLQKACARVRSGDMPPWQYLLMHPEARLSDRDIETLCAAVKIGR